ncbi:MAG: hypothetical protein JO132_17255 [Streptosporangiaceae bacterium]|nr:hypothetical protein [Streptosporangiaceae bacterium]
MTTLEDRVRAACRAAAETVPPGSVPPLRLPAGQDHVRGGWSWFASPWARRLAPVAAALAVFAVVIAIVTVGKTTRQPPAGHHASGPGPMTSGPSAAAYVASGQIPRYYVAITSRGNPSLHPSYAVVQATTTGATLAAIEPSVAHGTILAVTAAADDRTFVLDEAPYAMGGNSAYGPRTFYLLRLRLDGHLQSLSRLPMSVPGGQWMTGLALSPDASKLAMAVVPDPARQRVQLRVYTLATATVRTWYGTGIISIGLGADDAASLSWAADERTLAFDWAGSNSGVWLLNLDASGNNLLADSRQVAIPATGGNPLSTQPGCEPDMIITLDGSAIVCGGTAGLNPTTVGTTIQRGAETEFFEYSTATGKLARTLGHWTIPNAPILIAGVLWSNPSGSVLIGVIPYAGGLGIGVIHGNEFTPLPVAVYGYPFHSGTW